MFEVARVDQFALYIYILDILVDYDVQGGGKRIFVTGRRSLRRTRVAKPSNHLKSFAEPLIP